MKCIGLTGNSGVGKSTICEILKNKYHVEIIDADKIAKQLTKEASAYLTQITEKFGTEILDETGKLNRKQLANIIYTDNQKREELNQITFIHVVEEIKQRIERIAKNCMVVIDAPLLFESRLDKLCDVTIGVIAKNDTKLDRICKRDKIDRKTAQKRIAVQLKDKYLLEHSDYIIENESSIEELERKVEELNIF